MLGDFRRLVSALVSISLASASRRQESRLRPTPRSVQTMAVLFVPLRRHAPSFNARNNLAFKIRTRKCLWLQTFSYNRLQSGGASQHETY